MLERHREAGEATTLETLILELFAYEQDRFTMDDARLDDWLAALSAVTHCPITRPELGQRGQSLRQLHVAADTAERRTLRAVHEMVLEIPPGEEITLDRTQTLFGAINHEVLKFAPKQRTRGHARILNARHYGVEIATVLSGAMRLVLTRDKIETWKDIAHGAEIVRDVTLGPGQTVIFPSRYWHHAELKRVRGGSAVQSLNITGNLWLHRRYRGALAPT
jgi:hypothetical protein